VAVPSKVCTKAPIDGKHHGDIDIAIAVEHLCLAATEQAFLMLLPPEVQNVPVATKATSTENNLFILIYLYL